VYAWSQTLNQTMRTTKKGQHWLALEKEAQNPLIALL
jgi:hypothetical protein